jgi:hypothetical protein
MKQLKQLPLEELDDLFRQATTAAKQAADARGLPTVGQDSNFVATGPLIKSSGADHEPEADHEHGRNVA